MMDTREFLGRTIDAARAQMGSGSVASWSVDGAWPVRSASVASWASPRLVALECGWSEESMRGGLSALGVCWTDIEQVARGREAQEGLLARALGRRAQVEVRGRVRREPAPPAPLVREVVEEVEEEPRPALARPARAAHPLDAGVYLALDVETTGSTDQDRVIELALVFFRGFEPVKEVVQRYSAQGRAIDPFAAKVHGIREHHLRGCPNIERDLARVYDWLTRAPAVVAHNMSYDKRMLGYELARLGLSWPAAPTLIDTLPLAKRANPGKKKGFTLNDVCFLYRVPLERHHSALHDARAAGLIWRALYERGVRV